MLPLRHVIIFEGFGGAELPQRQADDEDRQQDSDGRRDGVLRRGHRQLIDPRHQNIRPAGVRSRHRRAAVVKQINNVEIIKVEGVLGDDDRRDRLQHQRQGDGAQAGKGAGAVHRRRFIQIVRDRLQHAGGHGKDKRKAKPGLHHDQRGFGPERVG